MTQVSNQVNTTVIINQPVFQGPKLLVGSRNGSREWTTGLFGCFEDCGSLCKACFCLPCTVCELSTRMGDCMLMPYCVPSGIITMRTRTRTLGDIRGTICMDYIATSCCQSCAVCQMDRELKAMGL